MHGLVFEVVDPRRKDRVTRSRTLRRESAGAPGRQQGGFFQEAAEFFFADAVKCSFFGGEAGHGLVFHFELFQPHDAKIFLTLFPDLALSQLHGHHYTNRVRALATRFCGRNLSLLIFVSEETAEDGRLTLLGGG